MKIEHPYQILHEHKPALFDTVPAALRAKVKKNCAGLSFYGHCLEWTITIWSQVLRSLHISHIMPMTDQATQVNITSFEYKNCASLSFHGQCLSVPTSVQKCKSTAEGEKSNFITRFQIIRIQVSRIQLNLLFLLQTLPQLIANTSRDIGTLRKVVWAALSCNRWAV